MAPKKSTAHASAPVKKTVKKQAAKKTAVAKPTTKKAVSKKAVAKKPKSKPAAKLKPAVTSGDAAIEDDTNEVTGDTDESSTVATTFPHFQKLPLELRLKIWGFAPPEPVTVIQRVSEKNNTRFTYRRKPPAVLHACRESRQEYLDTDEGTESASVARRRKEHPVYKLYFQAERTRCTPAYFSVDIDSFYGREYLGKSKRKQNVPTWSMRHQWGGISELDIANSLKHLVIKPAHWHDIGHYFRERFPKLEVVTILWRSALLVHIGPPLWQYVRSKPPPEINGEMDLNAMPPKFRSDFITRKSHYEQRLAEAKVSHPEWTPPIVRMRFEEQFLANANFTR
jgi:hypothetical protein